MSINFLLNDKAEIWSMAAKLFSSYKLLLKSITNIKQMGIIPARHFFANTICSLMIFRRLKI